MNSKASKIDEEPHKDKLLHVKDHEQEKKFAENKSYSSISLKHYDSFLGDLRCPGCANTLSVPIRLCVNGHSLCKLCRIRLTSCPVCNGELSDIRSATLEKLVGKYQFPCVNLKNGCFVRLPFELMKTHEKNCIYKITSCFMGNVYKDCEWKGRESDWYEHCKVKHASKILRTPEKHLLVWNYETLNNRPGSILSYYIIENFNETFNMYQVYEKKNNIITWTVIKAQKSKKQRKEKPSEHEKFSYEIELFNKNCDQHLMIQRFPVHPQNHDAFLEEGNCVRVTLKDIERFLDDDKNLYYYVNILAETSKKWDHLLDTMNTSKIKHRLSASIVEKTEDFFDFDSSTDTENVDYIFIDDQKKDGDMIKVAFDKEFNNPTYHPNAVQKPPRKSAGSLKSLPINFSQ